jgi:hypothetical protein
LRWPKRAKANAFHKLALLKLPLNPGALRLNRKFAYREVGVFAD